MTTFGWKRKLGSSVCKEITAKFSLENLEEDSKDNKKDHDWERCFKRRKTMLMENAEKESVKLKEEGANLAENGRHGEAVLKLEAAIQLNPHDAKLHEMKAQVLMQLNEFFPAINATEKAIQLEPQWWIAYQTLGRAQLGVGEIKMAIISFSKALHINPTNKELWENDLRFSVKILNERKKLKEQEILHKENDEYEGSKIILDEHGVVKNVTGTDELSKMSYENIVQCRL